jgi:nitrogen regulatory protein P-II 1
MKREIKAILQPFLVPKVLDTLHEIPGIPAVTISETRTFHLDGGHYQQVVQSKLEVIVPDELLAPVIEAIQSHGGTGRLDEGFIVVIPVESVLPTAR